MLDDQALLKKTHSLGNANVNRQGKRKQETIKRVKTSSLAAHMFVFKLLSLFQQIGNEKVKNKRVGNRWLTKHAHTCLLLRETMTVLSTTVHRDLISNKLNEQHKSTINQNLEQHTHTYLPEHFVIFSRKNVGFDQVVESQTTFTTTVWPNRPKKHNCAALLVDLLVAHTLVPSFWWVNSYTPVAARNLETD